MNREKRLVLVAHCILNQNSVVREWERAKGAYNDVVRLLLDSDLGIIQLPCPEFLYNGEARPPLTKEEYDTPEYRSLCRQLAGPVVQQALEYQKNGYEITGLIGIEESPTCDTGITGGVFMEELRAELLAESITLNAIDIPESYIEGEGGEILAELTAFLTPYSIRTD